MNAYLDYVKHSDVSEDQYVGTEMSPNELYHYGILGMRWGHRKNPEHVGLGDRIRRKRQLRKQGNIQRAINKNSKKYPELAKKYRDAGNKMGRIMEDYLYNVAAKKDPKIKYTLDQGGIDELWDYANDQLLEGANENAEYIQAKMDYKRYQDELINRR